MFNYKKGIEVAQNTGNNKTLYINTSGSQPKRRMMDEFGEDETGPQYIEIKKGNFVPLPSFEERDVTYICGPSGSGKSTFAANLMYEWQQEYPEGDIYAFCRTDLSSDPAFSSIEGIKQIMIDESLLEDPIDIEEEITTDTMILFDDITTIQSKPLKEAVEGILADVMEVGRKLRIWIIATSHLIIPNEKKLARTILNECQKLVVFPRAGSVQQIRYALTKYFGFTNRQISGFMKTDSRWLLFNKSYPQYVLSEYQAWIP